MSDFFKGTREEAEQILVAVARSPAHTAHLLSWPDGTWGAYAFYKGPGNGHKHWIASNRLFGDKRDWDGLAEIPKIISMLRLYIPPVITEDEFSEEKIQQALDFAND